MSDLFDVKVISRRNRVVVLDLVLVGDAQWVYTDKDFVLQILCEAAAELRLACSLADAIPGPQRYDPATILAKQDDFIARVDFVDSNGKLPNGDETARYWTVDELVKQRKSKQGSFARLEIEVTDPKWIEHLKKGLAWSSAAYAMNT